MEETEEGMEKGGREERGNDREDERGKEGRMEKGRERRKRREGVETEVGNKKDEQRGTKREKG